jgi:hypothetical protein
MLRFVADIDNVRIRSDYTNRDRNERTQSVRTEL